MPLATVVKRKLCDNLTDTDCFPVATAGPPNRHHFSGGRKFDDPGS